MAVPSEKQHVDLEEAENRALERMFRRIEAKRAGRTEEPDAMALALQAEKDADAAGQSGFLHSTKTTWNQAVESAQQLVSRLKGRGQV